MAKLERIPYETLLPQPQNRSEDKTMEHAFVLAELVALRAHAKWRDDNKETAEAATAIAEAIAVIAAAWRNFAT